MIPECNLQKKGYNTMESILDKQSTIIIPNNLDVFVMDTETRELKSKIAREKLRNLLKKLNIFTSVTQILKNSPVLIFRWQKNKIL